MASKSAKTPGSVTRTVPVPAARLDPPLVMALAGLTVVVALGVFRDGALLPAERPPLVVALLALGTFWIAVERGFWSRRSSPSASGLRAFSCGAYHPARTAQLSLGGLSILAGLALLSCLWSSAPARSFWMALVYVGGVVMFFAGRRLHGWHLRGLPGSMVLLGAVGALVAWISVVGYGLGWDAYVDTIGTATHALGPFGYANALASFVVVTLPATAWIAGCSRGGWPARTLAGVGLALEFWALWLTHSRGAALSLGAAAFLVLLLVAVRVIKRVGNGARRRMLLGGLGAGVIVVVLVAGLLMWHDLRPQASGGGIQQVADGGQSGQPVAVVRQGMSTDLYRVNTWMAGLKAARERPIYGWGMDTFYEAYGPFKAGGQTRFAHNVVVQHAVELGLLGLLALGLACMAALTMSCRAVLRGSLRDPGVWLGVSITAFLAHNLVDLTWYVPALFCLCWFCVGGVAAGDPPRALGAPRKAGARAAVGRG